MPNFEIVMVDKEHEDGTIDCTWIQGACACTLEEATARAKHYADTGRSPYTLIDGYSSYIDVGRMFYDAKPLCPIMRK